jgi:hypothetical protein
MGDSMLYLHWVIRESCTLYLAFVRKSHKDIVSQMALYVTQGFSEVKKIRVT